jgi:hypothetical protein
MRRFLSLKFQLYLEGHPTPETLGEVLIAFGVHIPREHVVYFAGSIGSNAMKKIIVSMPRIQELPLVGVPSPDGSQLGPLFKTKVLPSLRYLHLEYMTEKGWRPLIPCLVNQTSDGKVVSLQIYGRPTHVCPSVMGRIKGLVEELVLDLILDELCPLGICWEDEMDTDSEQY